MAEVLLNQEQIKEIIPHRAPFLLIDEVLSMEVGKKVVARKYIKEDDFWFKGHFPEKPVTPGVLMIEMLAQAGAVCILSQPEAGCTGRCSGLGSGNHQPERSNRYRQGSCQRCRQKSGYLRNQIRSRSVKALPYAI